MMSSTLGPFLQAFSEALATRVGGSASDWFDELFVVHDRAKSVRTVVASRPGAPILIFHPDDLPPDAAAQLAEFDLRNALTLRWSKRKGRWRIGSTR